MNVHCFIRIKKTIFNFIENDELEAIINGKTTLFEFRVQRTFKKLDTDGSGSLDVDEIRNYLVNAMGDDFNEE